MLVIPIGQEQNVVRRNPWVAYALIGLNVLVFVGTTLLGGASAKVATLEKTRHEAMEMLARHPYLTVPAALAPTLTDEGLVALERARARSLKRGVPGNVDVPAEQARLEELAATFSTAYQALPTQRLGYVPASPKPYALLTAMFMHGGWMHLFGNMLFFLLTGPFVEDVYGRPLFAGFYLAGGIAATLTHATAQPSSHAALVGASGAIAAVMGAFLVRFGTRRIGFLLIPIPVVPWIRTEFLMPAFVVIPFWFAQQVLFAHSDRASSTAWWAHIGGFAVGLAFALAMRAGRVEQRVIDPVIRKQVELTAHPSLEAIVDARVEGRLEEARALVDDVVKREPANLDGWQEAYEVGLAQGDAALAGRAIVRLVELYAKGGENELAAQLVHDVRWAELGPLPPQAYLSVAGWLEKEGDLRRALDVYGEVARVAPTDPKALRALVRRGEIYTGNGNHREARFALERAREHPAYGPPWTTKVEATLATLPRPVALASEEGELDV